MQENEVVRAGDAQDGQRRQQRLNAGNGGGPLRTEFLQKPSRFFDLEGDFYFFKGGFCFLNHRCVSKLPVGSATKRSPTGTTDALEMTARDLLIDARSLQANSTAAFRVVAGLSFSGADYS